MARPPSTHPTDGELEILRVLWDRGPLALSELCQSLRRQRDVATTTVATMLRVMLGKRLVKRKRAARGHQWSASVTQSAAANSMVGKLVDGIFDGSAQRLVAHLVEAGQLSPKELAELRELIDSNRVPRKSAKSQRT
ncbi:MAG: BlaI/MecI/CopY family transcriptional regulator [Planctomycetes bacterium]|nr:BlaI/MecI/CopY family transcriptional regulator [Planctomycetota bacterium]